MKTAPERHALLEIGVEEIPARFMAPALAQLSELLAGGLQEAGLAHGAIETLGTPRRLAALIRAVAPRSSDRVDTVVGPPPKAAKDASGAWTQAALGFAKAQSVSVDKLVLQETPKGERYVALHPVKGQKTEQVLKDLFPAVIRRLSFPKSMIWDDKEFHFARPIRWIAALYNGTVIRFRLGRVASDRATYGLFSLGGQKITIAKPEKYASLLQGRCILVDPEERRKQIRAQIDAMAKRVKGTVIADADHLNEVVQLTEYPVAILGHFPEGYLRLPKEILIIVLQKHQKFFPIESAKGQLLNAFIGVRNGPSESQDDVRDGYERVVNARFSDAQFFYEKDLQQPLETLAPKLSGVGFHEKLGTIWDKTGRVRKLVQSIGSTLGLSAEVLQRADRIALLGKADLLTQIVGEFPELQGVAGRFYAEKQETPEIAKGIEQHYWPLTTDSRLPESDAAALVAVADKIDTLAANFSVGLIPTGSADPYGLRRSSVGVLRILADRQWPVSPESLIDAAFGLLTGGGDARKAKGDLVDFFRQRAMSLFGNQGFRPDEMDAVLSLPGQSVASVLQKLSGLKAVRGRPEFDSLASAIKRARNILTQAQQKNILPSDGALVAGELQSDAERALHQSISEARPGFQAAVDRHDFKGALLQLAPLKRPVDDFFAGVMVMVDDEKVRGQRLLLLKQVKELFDAVADFSKLQAGAPAAAVSA